MKRLFILLLLPLIIAFAYDPNNVKVRTGRVGHHNPEYEQDIYDDLNDIIDPNAPGYGLCFIQTIIMGHTHDNNT